MADESTSRATNKAFDIRFGIMFFGPKTWKYSWLSDACQCHSKRSCPDGSDISLENMGSTPFWEVEVTRLSLFNTCVKLPGVYLSWYVRPQEM